MGSNPQAISELAMNVANLVLSRLEPMVLETMASVQKLEFTVKLMQKKIDSLLESGGIANTKTTIPILDESDITKGRALCPRCEGRGWRHDSGVKHSQKHDQRCPGCSSCRACYGVGVVTNKKLCQTCRARGFVHLNIERSHDASPSLRCGFCVDCPDCDSVGVVDQDCPLVSLRVKAGQQRSTGKAGSISEMGGSMDFVGALLCPRCAGKGWSHESGGKHDTQSNTKCSLCRDCIACAGSGIVSNKRACPVCHARGFVHESTRDAHTTVESLQCPHCIPCGHCSSLGVVDVDTTLIKCIRTSQTSDPLHSQRAMCLNCQGRGWKHENKAAHSKTPSIRCKLCSECSVCNGTGVVTAKKNCRECQGLGFLHPSQAQVSHPADSKARCSGCVDCVACNGVGATSTSTVASARTI
ncbi:uncharacterized protein BJ171DRAFT_198665 [Polychytrium aggregatum]|uniref:uncharacterized protein n=1 Tax=Polychytrium aggregatum TaxID=110093 RepID=UPI0022FEEC96|nr:uncharacterized protein BJ171DRAFT_198665 [Polychytrium aggregatum]KAI9199780.1 hypothetical protein BJ171DRAFT_198665 [Polychytrium aggregatum]